METLEDRNLLSAGVLNPHLASVAKTQNNSGVIPAQGLVNAVLGPDGNTVLLGTIQHGNNVDLVVTELTKDGSINSNFGTGGVATLRDLGDLFGADIAVQRDGTIVVEGIGTARNVYVAELNKNGSLKSSFGNGGETIISAPAGYSAYGATDFVVKPDGEIVLYTGLFELDNLGTGIPTLVVGLTKDGHLNPDFGSGGERILDPYPFGTNIQWAPTSAGYGQVPVNPLAVLPNGAIVLTANAFANDFSFVDVGVVELTKDGNLNNSFGNGGKALIDFGPNLPYAFLTHAIVNEDGTILLGANTSSADGSLSYMAVAELNKHGRLNAGFGVGGEALVDFGPNYFPFMTNIAVQPGDTIVLGGTVINTAGHTDFAVAELNDDGQLKANFGTGGKTIADFGANYALAAPGPFTVATVTFAPDGTVVLAATVTNISTGQTDFAVADLTDEGNLNSKFGTGGESIIDFGVGNPVQLTNLLVQPDGSIVLAGFDNSSAGGIAWAVIDVGGQRHDHHWWQNDD